MVVIDNSDPSPAASWVISQVLTLDISSHLKGEEDDVGVVDATQNQLPFGRRPISFFDANASEVYKSQARGIVKVRRADGQERSDDCESRNSCRRTQTIPII